MPNFQALKFPERITWYNMNHAVSTTKNLDIVLNTLKNPYLNWATHKKIYLPNSPTQKNPGNENFKPKKILR